MGLDELIAREAVRDTYARYNHSGDRARLDELAACFTPDGVLEVRDRFTATGRSEIATALTDVKSLVRTDEPPPPGMRYIMRHYVANLLFKSVAPERIETEAYFVVFLVDGADHWGRYRDVLVPADGRWLIAHRFVSIDGKRPGSTA